MLHHLEVVRAVIQAGTKSSNLLELLDRKGIPSMLLGVNALGGPPDFQNIPTELVKKRFMPFDLFFHRNDIECLANR